MIIERKIIEVKTRKSDYCKGCPYFSSEQIKTFAPPLGDVAEKTRVIEVCSYCNVCDRLYRAIRGEKNATE